MLCVAGGSCKVDDRLTICTAAGTCVAGGSWVAYVRARLMGGRTPALH